MNLIEQVRHRNTGMRRCFAMAVVTMLEYVSQRLARKNLTFTVGREMYNAYKRRGGRIHEIAVSLVSERDIENTIRTKSFELHKPVRLLSVGRLDPEKGLGFLVEAVEVLTKEKRLNVVLQIVGKGLKGGEERRLREDVKKGRLTRHIRFRGYISYEPELFRLYRESDIFVLPSLTGEGFPQTLFEAMACGIPIIATKVAGIPYVIKDGHNGLLVNPASPAEICLAMERLINDSGLRKQLITNGISAVKNHTLEAERSRIILSIGEFVDQSRG
jgi:glycosyltransferase involved in cell wall biosynthesis